MTSEIMFVTADMEVWAADMAVEGKSGGCGLPVASQWRVRNARRATPAELAEHAALVAALTAEVESRRYLYVPTSLPSPGEWAIRADVDLYARIGWVATGQQEWGHRWGEFRFLVAA